MTPSPDDLLRPEAWPDGLDLPIAREETHASVVLLRGETALKLKKPVSLGFLDFSTAARRRVACEDEVRLNRRLAPDVYLGVQDVRLGPDGRWTLTGDGPVVEAAVRMRRLPPEATLEARVDDGRLTARDLRRVAERIARFHDEAPRSAEIDRYAAPALIRANAEENFVQAGPEAARILGEEAAARARARLRDFLERHEDRLRARIAAGRICEGHGDLRLDHVYLLGPEVVVLDCVEFSDPRTRCQSPPRSRSQNDNRARVSLHRPLVTVTSCRTSSPTSRYAGSGAAATAGPGSSERPTTSAPAAPASRRAISDPRTSASASPRTPRRRAGGPWCGR
jgi:aminoglycoside phosphotransferase family enzyme